MDWFLYDRDLRHEKIKAIARWSVKRQWKRNKKTKETKLPRYIKIDQYKFFPVILLVELRISYFIW